MVIFFFVSLVRYKTRKYVKMLKIRIAGEHLYWKWLFTLLLLVMSLMVPDFVLCRPFSHEMSWIRPGTELSQFLRISYLLFQSKKINSNENHTLLGKSTDNIFLQTLYVVEWVQP